MPESWQPVVGHEGAYEVSDLGRVRSLPGGQRRGVMLKPFPIGRGYLAVSLCAGGTVRKAYVHQLVAAAFIGPRPNGLDVCHNNGQLTDNQSSNIRYATVSANNRDAVAHGRHSEASRTHCDHGHEFTPENTYVETSSSVDGGVKRRRRCRICRTATCRTTYLRRKARAA